MGVEAVKQALADAGMDNDQARFLGYLQFALQHWQASQMADQAELCVFGDAK